MSNRMKIKEQPATEIVNDLTIDTTIETTAEEDSNLLATVLKRLEWEFIREMLVKPLEEVMVEKVFTSPVETGNRDEHGMPIYDTKEETKTVEANFKRGIILSLPQAYEWPKGFEVPEVGDTIAYSRKGVMSFDLFKDAELVNPYNIVSVIRANQKNVLQNTLDNIEKLFSPSKGHTKSFKDDQEDVVKILKTTTSEDTMIEVMDEILNAYETGDIDTITDVNSATRFSHLNMTQKN